jgi:hypothetical protein
MIRSGDALARRLGHGQNGWELHPRPITDRNVLPMRSYVNVVRTRLGQFVECALAVRALLSGGRLAATGGRSIGREDRVDVGKPPPA